MVLSRWVSIAGWLVVLGLLTGGVVSSRFHVAAERERTERLFAHANDVRNEAQRLLSALQDAETGRSGYLLTGRPEQLDPVTAVGREARERLDALAALTSDDASQQRRVAELRTVTAEKFGELQETIDLVRAGDGARAVRVLLSGRGKELLDQARDLLADVKEGEESRFRLRRAEAEEAIDPILLYGIPALLGAAGLAAVFARRISRWGRLADRYRLERDARYADARLRAIVDTAVDAMVVIDARGLIQSFNQAAETIFGYTEEEAAGRNVRLLMPEPDRGAHDGHIARYLRTGERRIIGIGREVEGRRKDGSTFSLELAIAEWAVDGERYFTGIMRDITARRNAENHLREREGQLALFIEGAPAAIAMFDREMRYLATSRRFATDYRINATSPKDLIGRSHYELFPDIPQRWRDIHVRVLAGETLSAEADPFPRIDGRIDWVRWRMEPWRDASGAIGGALLFTEIITALKEAEARVARQATLLDQAQEAILVWEIDGGISFWNRGAASLYGYEPAEALGRVSHELLKTRHPLPVADFIAMLKREGKWSGEIEHTTRDGRILTVETSMVVVREPGDCGIVLETNRDVTERKRAETALRDALIRLDAAKKASRLGVYDFDIEADRIDWDERVRELWGVSAEDTITYADFLAGVRPEDHAATNAAVASALDPAGDGEYAAEYRVFNGRDGVERWVAATGRVYFEGGKAVRLIGTVADVTARRKAEDALAAKEAQLRTILEAVPVGIVLGELPSGRVLSGNTHVEAMLRHPVLPSPDINSYDEWVSYHADGTRVAGHEYPFARMVLFGEEAPEIEVHYQRGDGTRSWIRIMGRPVRDSAGAMIGAVAALIDVDVERRARDALNRTAEDLEHQVQERTAQLVQAQKMEVVGQLSGGMAHDFNNLLQGIGGFLSVLEPHVPPGNLRTLFKATQESIQRGARLTQSMLAFARRQMLAPKPTDPASLFDVMRPLLERTLGGLIRIEIEVAPGTALVMADPAQLESAILNLAINARDAMPTGGWLALRARNASVARPSEGARPPDLLPGDYVVVSMTDTGTGMDAATLAHVFEPFFTTKEVGRGSGLGLSMVHGMAAQSGGGVTIASVPGEGTTVTLYLPRARPVGKPASELSPVTPPRSVGHVVLLVDDDALVRAGVAVGLEGAGYRVLKADDGPAALKALRDGAAVDALVTDYAMPGMNGVTLIKEARLIAPGLVIVLITGYADKPEGVEPDAVLHKPFTPQNLASYLSFALGKGRAENVVFLADGRTS